MASNKKNALLWTAAGLLLSMGVLALVLGGLEGDILIAGEEDIPLTADAVLRSIQDGDWDSLSELVSGNPDLEPQLPEDGSAERMIWDAYRNSLQWQTEENYHIAGSRIHQTVHITCLDIAAVAKILQESPVDASRERK